MYLNFENEQNRLLALNTKSVNYEEEDGINEADAFIYLIKDVDYQTIDTLCENVSAKLGEDIELAKKVDPKTIYALINDKSIPEFKNTILEQAYNLVHEGKKLGTKTDGKRNASNWIIHCLIEGELIKELAENIGLDPHVAMKLGILHDIGRKFDHSFKHTVKGFEYLIEHGLINESFSTLTHSFLPIVKGDISKGNRCAIGDPPIDGFYINQNGEGVFEENAKLDDVTKFLENYEYSPYDVILNIADLMATSEGVKTPYERMLNIYSKRTPDPRNSSFFKVCFINALYRFLNESTKESKYHYNLINIKDMDSDEEIDRLLFKVSDIFMDNYLNNIRKNTKENISITK